VYLPLPGPLGGALLLQELQQPHQAIWTNTTTTITNKKSSCSPRPTTIREQNPEPAELTLRDEVGVEDELVRHYEAPGHKELVVRVILHVVQRVHAGEAHRGQLLQGHQSRDLQGEERARYNVCVGVYIYILYKYIC